jgi:hypothetical protein
MLSVLFVIRRNEINHTHKFVVYKVDRYLALDFISSGKNILIADSILVGEKKVMNYAVTNHWIDNGLEEPLIHKFEDDVIEYEQFFKYKSYIKFRDKRILVIDGKKEVSCPSGKMKMDYLVLRKNPNYSIKFLNLIFNPEVIIVSMDNSLWKLKQWEEENETDVVIWPIWEKGAFVEELD